MTNADKIRSMSVVELWCRKNLKNSAYQSDNLDLVMNTVLIGLLRLSERVAWNVSRSK